MWVFVWVWVWVWDACALVSLFVICFLLVATARISTMAGGESAAPIDMATLKVVFVDDEPANVRMGLRMLGRMGVLAANVVQLKDGA